MTIKWMAILSDYLFGCLLLILLGWAIDSYLSALTQKPAVVKHDSLFI